MFLSLSKKKNLLKKERERDNRPKMESLVLGPTIANQDLRLNLTAISASQECNLTIQHGITWSGLER